jgi:hypothetical protein
MPSTRPPFDDDTLQAALIGYQQQLSVIVQRIAEVRARLGGRYSAAFTAPEQDGPAPARKKRTMSEAAKRRIAAGQKKRWAAVKAARKAEAAKKQGSGKAKAKAARGASSSRQAAAKKKAPAKQAPASA